MRKRKEKINALKLEGEYRKGKTDRAGEIDRERQTETAIERDGERWRWPLSEGGGDRGSGSSGGGGSGSTSRRSLRKREFPGKTA